MKTRKRWKAFVGSSILALLVSSGSTDVDALHVYRLFFGFLYGMCSTSSRTSGGNPEETDDLLRLGLHRLPIREFPILRSLAPALASYDGAAELDRGLDILLSGLQVQPRRPARHPRDGEAMTTERPPAEVSAVSRTLHLLTAWSSKAAASAIAAVASLVVLVWALASRHPDRILIWYTAVSGAVILVMVFVLHTPRPGSRRPCTTSWTRSCTPCPRPTTGS